MKDSSEFIIIKAYDNNIYYKFFKMNFFLFFIVLNV